MRNKVRMEGKGKVGFGVSSHILVEILEESIRVFWQFIRSDKDSTRKGKKPGHSQLQDPAGAEVLAEVETALEKKQKRLEEVLRGGKCILRKFLKQHHHEYYFSDHVIGFFSHVDMRLVRRVLNMSRLSTDQLAWCSAKLGRINFVHRRMHVQPSFILFPC
ncbi:hypothetical protein SAY87_018595 [Trapa incisa]|uniref:Uncharacterized protein n=1 Tax=Trapa incisa TaxID=236973 RepID=A0AAN7KXV9_9MYRT|nr:hypothetical protein SAY87_018595 [Trapa incisa]